MANLKNKAITGAFWNIFDRVGSQIVRLGIGIILARILMPRDYGLVGMLAIFISVGDALVESGFSQALIQKNKPSQKDYSSVFYLNIAIALIIFLLLWVSSPLIVRFFEEPKLELLVPALSAGIIIRSFIIIPRTIYIKELDFSVLAKYRILSFLLAGGVAIPMAIKGFGVWSLVVLRLTQYSFLTLFLWLKNSWRPSFVFSINSIKNLFSFGSRILGLGLLDNIFLHVYSLIIGKFFSASLVGYYNRAKMYTGLISKNMLMMINAVGFPAFSKIKDNLSKVRHNYVVMSNLTVFVVTPLLLLLAFTAEPLIRVLITDKWLDSVPYLQVLSFGGILAPISGVQQSILKAIGKVNNYFWIKISQKVVIIISIIVAIRWGVIGLVYAQVFSNIFLIGIGSYSMKRFLNISMYRQLYDILTYVIIGVVVFYPVYLLMNFYFDNDLLLILTQLFVGLLVYYFLTYLLKLDGNKEATFIFKEKFLTRYRKYKKDE